MDSTIPDAPTLDYRQQSKFLEQVSQGLSLEEAALSVNSSLRAVLQMAKDDYRFDRQLQLCQFAAPSDPEKLMQQHAKSHWRAAAWLLERTDPDRYGRRRADSCTATQFLRAIGQLLHAALDAVPDELHAAIAKRFQAVADESFETIFPTPVAARCSARRLPAVAGGSGSPRPAPLASSTPQTTGELSNGILSPETRAATEMLVPPSMLYESESAVADRDFDQILRRVFEHGSCAAPPSYGVPHDSVAKNALGDNTDGSAAFGVPPPIRVA